LHLQQLSVLIPTYVKVSHTDKPSDHEQTKSFLNDLEKTLGSQLQNQIQSKDTRRISQFDKDLNKAVRALNHEKDWILAPTNKTNRWYLVRVEDYKTGCTNTSTKSVR